MKKIYILLFFLFLTFLFTYPSIKSPSSKVYGFQRFAGDQYAVIYQIWWVNHHTEFIVNANFIPIISWPWGVSLEGLPKTPVFEGLIIILKIIHDEGFIYNLIVWIGLLSGALAMYFLVFYFTKNKMAGLLAGVIFSFSPNHVMQSALHLGFALILWMPLYVYTLFKLFYKPGFKWMLISGVLLSLTILSNYYYGYFLALFTIMLIVLRLGAVGFRLKETKWLCGVFVIVFLIIVFFVYPLIIMGGSNIGGEVYAQPLSDLIKYAARWWDYFLPSEFHPLFGRYTQSFSRHYFERSLYIGYIPLMLAMIAIIKRKTFGKEGLIVSYFSIIAILFFMFSLSPIFRIGFLKIPNFSFFMHKILPMFRVYARMGIIVSLSIGVLAGFGFKYIFEKLKSKRAKIYLSSFCVIGILFEYMIFPPFHAIDLSNVPDVYKWLKNQAEGVVVAEYPYVRNIEEQQYKYQFYQRIHKKPIINGGGEGALGDAFRKQMYYLENNETPKLLAYLGVSYVILHKEFYSDTGLKDIRENSGLEFIKEFPDAIVYKINAKPDDLITVFWQNFGNWEKWDDGSYWRWMGNNATIWVGNGSLQSQKSKAPSQKLINIECKILTFAKERELEMYINDMMLKKIKILPQNDSRFAERIVLENVKLNHGQNIIKFYTPQEESRIGDVLHNNDDRSVCFAISDFKITPR